MSDPAYINLEDVKPKVGLKVYNAAEMLALDLPPRENILAPWLPKQGLAMLYGPRGSGKTHVALNIAYAVATGGQFLAWKAPTARRVLYIDGEMPAAAMRDRLAGIVASTDLEPPEADFIQLALSDLQEFGIGCLTSDEGKAAIEPYLKHIELVVIDNLSTLTHSVKENEGDSWVPVQNWALSLRRRGISVLFIHHSGKGGSQRGTSRKEDVLDSVLALRRPLDYEPDEGARFEVHFEKSRGIMGDDVKPFEAALVDGLWHTKDLSNILLDEVVRLTGAGESIRNIAEILGITRMKVQRLQTKARSEGLING